jgi:hypothetical protein
MKTQETEEVVRARNESFDADKKTAAPWSEVKKRILSQREDLGLQSSSVWMSYRADCSMRR